MIYINYTQEMLFFSYFFLFKHQYILQDSLGTTRTSKIKEQCFDEMDLLKQTIDVKERNRKAMADTYKRYTDINHLLICLLPFDLLERPLAN